MGLTFLCDMYVDKLDTTYYKFWAKRKMIELYLKSPNILSINQVKLFWGLKK